MVMAQVQTDQVKQLKAIFTRFDMNSDGSLTHLELAALLRSIGLKPQGDQIHALLSNMDKNANGSIEFEELLNAILPDLNEEVLINHDQLMEVFRSFDKDGNGYITAAELAGQMAKMGQPLKDGKLMSDAETGEFFGGFTPLPRKTATDDTKRAMCMRIV
ncbi:Calcium-binding EF-hand [Artemisia annua]|uniref:Calcium-binding EF-hand n=1 Tax=Artemisia annua TaxID=35608 RepID=A0A2U1N213_ARTAN|nr:Calcium-binding EF-hand [Artemisia annua]